MKLNELKNQFESVQKKMDKAAKEFPWADKTAYLMWLRQTYEYAASSTRILALTAGHFPLQMTAYSNRFISHAAEEKNHDRLLVADAKNLGHELMDIPLYSEAEAFHKSLYYWIYQGQPAAIFGWVLALEGFAVRNATQVYEECKKAHGEKAAVFLKVHAGEDEDHLRKAFESISALDESTLDLVAHAMKFYTETYISILNRVSHECKTSGVQKAA